jgi:transposase InsO family protein
MKGWGPHSPPELARRHVARKGDPSGQSWSIFLRNHAPHIAAMDLFVVPTIGFIQLYVLVIVRLARRELVWINVTRHPTTEWIAQQITEAFPWNEAPRNLVRDQDGIYGAAVRRRLPAMGIRDKPIAPGSPWQNGYAERLIGTIRRECVDHLIVFGEAHLHPSRVCRLLQWVTDPSRFEPQCSPPSAGSEHRRHHITTCSRRTSSPILPDLSFRHTQVHMREPLWGGADVWRFGHPL